MKSRIGGSYKKPKLMPNANTNVDKTTVTSCPDNLESKLVSEVFLLWSTIRMTMPPPLVFGFQSPSKGPQKARGNILYIRSHGDKTFENRIKELRSKNMYALLNAVRISFDQQVQKLRGIAERSVSCQEDAYKCGICSNTRVTQTDVDKHPHPGEVRYTRPCQYLPVSVTPRICVHHEHCKYKNTQER